MKTLCFLLLPILLTAQIPASNGQAGNAGGGGGGAPAGCSISSGTLTCSGFSTSGATASGSVYLTGKTSGSTVQITVGDSTAASTLMAPGSVTGTIMPYTGSFANGDCVRASVSGSATTFITTGGGCASAPVNYYTSTSFAGIGPTSFTPTHSLDIYDATATTGNTSVAIRTGAGQAANMLALLSAGGSANGIILGGSGLNYSMSIPNISAEIDIGAGSFRIIQTQIQQDPTNIIGWRASVFGSTDTTLCRQGAGVIEAGASAGCGAGGTFRGLYQSSDGTAGITGATCTAWKNGLCVSL